MHIKHTVKMGDNFNSYPIQVYLNGELIESDVQENLSIDNC